MIRSLRQLLLAALFLVASVACAQAASTPDGTCGFCVLAPSGTPLKLTGTGSATLTRANVLVNSNGKPAVALTGTGGLNAPSVGVAGTVSVTGTGKVQNLTTGTAPADDPLAGLVPRNVIVPTAIPSVTVSGSKAATVVPGVYRDIALTGSGKLTLSPGSRRWSARSVSRRLSSRIRP